MLALLAPDDAPVATQRAPQPVPAVAPAPPPVAVRPANTAVSPPSDDYGYVSWCYGALGTYIELYDQVMPEVTRIESAFPGPDGLAADLAVYPKLRTQARADLKTYAAAIEAAEKASPRPISTYGATAMKKGRALWGGGPSVIPKAKMAQMWMSWSPPEKCETTAKSLKARASVLGQALAFNIPDGAEAEAVAGPVTPPQSSALGAMAPIAVMAAPKPPAPMPAPPAPMEMIAPKPAPVASVAAAPPAPKPEPAPPAAEVMAPAAPAPTPVAAEAPPPMPAPRSPAEPMPPVRSGPPADPALWYRGVP